jgi:UDP-N-acetylglucosamine 2-epimerase (non-hydrolysing)
MAAGFTELPATSVLSVVGTRPEVIKMAPVINGLAGRRDFISRVCAVGQHREMLQQALAVFDIQPDYSCDVMRPRQNLAKLTAALTAAIDEAVEACEPDWILAQGDTTTVLTASLVAFYRGVRFGHVEAGLRTGNLQHPFPEELNRRVADMVSSVCFAPTAHARDALIREGCDPARIHVTGNTIVDALHAIARRPCPWGSGPLARVDAQRPIVLLTAHRRESFGAPLRDIYLAVRDLAQAFASQGVQFVYPVHLNPNVKDLARELLSSLENVLLLDPLDYVSTVQLLRRSRLVLTDSGGIQEEAPSFNVPVLVLRDTTERPEGLATGLVRLVGRDRGRIVAEATRMLREPPSATQGLLTASPYGDGHAAERIIAVLQQRGSVNGPTMLEASVPA